MTKIGSTNLTYDSSDRNTYISEGTKNTSFVRDVQNRIVKRTAVNGITTTNTYGFTGSTDTPDLLLDAAGTAVIEKYLTLPGNVLVTIRPSQSGSANKVLSLPNIHGDTFATTDANGSLTSTFQYDPFGSLVGSSQPNNTTQGSSFAWLGQHQKQTGVNYQVVKILIT